VSRTNAVHSSIFGYLEAIVLIGALQFAAQKSGSWILWTMVGAGYLGQLILTTVYMRAGARLLLYRSPLSPHQKRLAGNILGLVLFAVGTWAIGAISTTVDQVVAAGLNGQ
jgi:hypothetical protein